MYINNNSVTNNYLWKTSRPYFAVQNAHGHATEFLQNLWTIWARALKKARQPSWSPSRRNVTVYVFEPCKCRFKYQMSVPVHRISLQGCLHFAHATTPQVIDQVHDLVLDDRRMKVREIAETVGISKERVGYILHEELDTKKVLRKMGVALAHSRSKTHSHENL
jgi:hypothetical protein